MIKMRELTVKPFKAADIVLLDLRDVDKEYLAAYNVKVLGESLERAGNCYTYSYKEKIIFIAGISIFWPGVGDSWVLCDKCVTRFARELLYYCDYYINDCMKKNNLHRVQATPRADWEPGINFVNRLGFNCEGLLNKYGSHKENHFMYARTI